MKEVVRPPLRDWIKTLSNDEFRKHLRLLGQADRRYFANRSVNTDHDQSEVAASLLSMAADLSEALEALLANTEPWSKTKPSLSPSASSTEDTPSPGYIHALLEKLHDLVQPIRHISMLPPAPERILGSGPRGVELISPGSAADNKRVIVKAIRDLYAIIIVYSPENKVSVQPEYNSYYLSAREEPFEIAVSADAERAIVVVSLSPFMSPGLPAKALGLTPLDAVLQAIEKARPDALFKSHVKFGP